MNRHERRAQAKLGRSGDGSKVYQTGLESQARNWGFPNVEAMREAHFFAAKAIVDRLPDDPTLSIGDCYMISACAFATAGGGATQTQYAQMFMSIEPFVRKDRRPTESEARQILSHIRKYLEAVELRGAWSLKGVGELSINDGPNDVDLSAESLNPSVAQVRNKTCFVCGKPFEKGQMVASAPYKHAPPPWTTVEVHKDCVRLLEPEGTA